MGKRRNAFITIYIFSFGSSGRRRLPADQAGRSNSPIIRIVRVSVRRPLSLGRLTGDVGVGRSRLSSIAQTSGARISLRHSGGSPSGTSPATLESGISTETVLAIGVRLGHTIHWHVSIGGSSGRGWTDWSTDNGRTSAFSAILTPTAFNRSAMNHLSLELDDSHRSVFVGVKFDESEATVRLHPDFGKVTT